MFLWSPLELIGSREAVDQAMRFLKDHDLDRGVVNGYDPIRLVCQYRAERILELKCLDWDKLSHTWKPYTHPPP